MYWYRGTLGAAQIAFTDRELGNMGLHVGDDEQAVRGRRRTLEEDLGVAEDTLLFLDQVHGVTVANADDPSSDTVPVADAAVSSTGRPLAVMVADCVPVVLVGSDPRDPALCVTAVAHAGRNGLLAGVLQQTVRAMRERGAAVLQAVVGPSVCGGCYEVPAEMAESAERTLAGIQGLTTWGTPSLDLPHAARRILEDSGVALREVEADSPHCTFENPRLSSHRRDSSSGRIVGVVHVPSADGWNRGGTAQERLTRVPRGERQR